MNLYAIGKQPSLKWYLILSLCLAAAFVSAALALRGFVTGALYFELFMLAVGTMAISAVFWDYFARFPILHIETRLTSAQVEGAVRFAETCPLKGSELKKAINGYLQAQHEKQKKLEADQKTREAENIQRGLERGTSIPAGDIAEQIRSAQENGHDLPV